MKTEDIVMLINAHYEGDDKTFTRVAANIASRETINEHPEAAKKIRNAINGVYPPMSHAEENAAYYEENIVSVSNFKVGCAAFIVAPNADMEPQDKYMDIDRVRVKETSTKNRSVTVDSGEVFAENNDRFDCLIGEDEESCSSYARRLFPTQTAAKKERKKCLLLALIQEEFKQTDNAGKYTVQQLKRAKTALGIEEGVHVNND